MKRKTIIYVIFTVLAILIYGCGKKESTANGGGGKKIKDCRNKKFTFR